MLSLKTDLTRGSSKRSSSSADEQSIPGACFGCNPARAWFKSLMEGLDEAGVTLAALEL